MTAPGVRGLGGTVIWITGPPASGKTTLARLLVDALKRRSLACLWLDSDDLRSVLTPRASYSEEERAQFYRALAHIARLGSESGAVVVISATGSRRSFRDDLRAGVPRFVEVALHCGERTLRARDVKGLYTRAGAGEIVNLPGYDAPYEPPEHPDMVLDSERSTPPRLLETVLEALGVPGGN